MRSCKSDAIPARLGFHRLCIQTVVIQYVPACALTKFPSLFRRTPTEEPIPETALKAASTLHDLNEAKVMGKNQRSENKDIRSSLHK